MKVDLSQKFLDIDGNPLKDEKDKDVRLYDVIRVAVTAELKEDMEGSGNQVIENKMKNYDIFLDVKEAGPECKEFELSAEHIVHIKGRLGKCFGTIVCGPTIRIFEGKPPYGTGKVKSSKQEPIDSQAPGTA